MTIDIRADAARYYNLNPEMLDDIGFYRDRIPSPGASVLELGCGTGRVLIPLVRNCGYIYGVDISEAMVSICLQKLTRESIPPSRANVQVGDITDIDLGMAFDLIIAPYRVFQNLETDYECEACYRGEDLSGKVVLKILMRCYYPEEFTASILKHGFEIVNCWGGYLGEAYGEGTELIVEFRNPS